MGQDTSKLALQQAALRMRDASILIDTSTTTTPHHTSSTGDPSSTLYPAFEVGKMWGGPRGWEDVWGMLSGEDWRSILRDRPENIHVLLREVVDFMTSWTAKLVAMNHEKGESVVDKTVIAAENSKALNCIRIITRIMPILYEQEKQSNGENGVYEDPDGFVERVLWRNLPPLPPVTVTTAAPSTETAPPQTGSAPDTQEKPAPTPSSTKDEQSTEPVTTEASGAEKKAEATSTETVASEVKTLEPIIPQPLPAQTTPPQAVSDDPNLPCLAVRMMEFLVQDLFLVNFTLGGTGSDIEKAPPSHNRRVIPKEYYWASGLGTESPVMPASRDRYSNRTEVLKCLLACLSEPLYCSPEQAKTRPNKWQEYLFCRKDYFSEALFASLVNSAITYDPVGWGLPYNHLFYDLVYEEAASTGLQLLNIAITYRPASDAIQLSQSTGIHTSSSSVPAESKSTNQFILMMQEISRTTQFQLLCTAFDRLVGHALLANTTKLPNSMRQIDLHQEYLLFFWRLAEENKKFLSFAILSEKSANAFVSLFFCMYDGRRSAAQLGLVQLATFVVLLLSGERDFAVALNKPFSGKFVDPMFSGGSHADLMVHVIHKMITDAHTDLSSMNECVLTIISNVSPFIKSFSTMSAVKLLNLFERLSSPNVFLANGSNWRLVQLLLEIFNNVIQYQFEGNSSLVFAILKQQNYFSMLAHLQIIAPPLKSSQPLVVPADSALPGAVDSTSRAEQSSAGQDQVIQSNPTNNNSAPTNAWLDGIKKQLPLDNILRIITNLSPRIQSMYTGSESDEFKILTFLKNTTLVGLLPVPHPILIRKYRTNIATESWLLSYLWGHIYLRQTTPPLFMGSRPKLFKVQLTDG